MNMNEIRLFTKEESSFNHNKRILNDTTECYVTETTDGIFDLDLVHPLNDNKKLSGDLVRENIIKSPFPKQIAEGNNFSQ